ncbi:MAG: winged-helix domain-containing protein [Phycisphaerae bacterium]|nr:winged-helix domain-containing protein [Tepidisphaeraceae bacterium]
MRQMLKMQREPRKRPEPLDVAKSVRDSVDRVWHQIVGEDAGSLIPEVTAVDAADDVARLTRGFPTFVENVTRVFGRDLAGEVGWGLHDDDDLSVGSHMAVNYRDYLLHHRASISALRAWVFRTGAADPKLRRFAIRLLSRLNETSVVTNPLTAVRALINMQQLVRMCYLGAARKPSAADSGDPREEQMDILRVLGHSADVMIQKEILRGLVRIGAESTSRTLRRDVNALERRGFIWRPDGRNCGYALTSAGRKLLAVLRQKA